MAGIVDVYRRHKDLLSVYFKSEAEAADCERRAEMGDDRAMHMISLASLIRAPEFKRSSTTNTYTYTSVTRYHYGVEYNALDRASAKVYRAQAASLGNHEVIDFVTSVAEGRRKTTITTPYFNRYGMYLLTKDYPEQKPEKELKAALKKRLDNMEEEGRKKAQEISIQERINISYSAHLYVPTWLPKGSYKPEIAPARIGYSGNPDQSTSQLLISKRHDGTIDLDPFEDKGVDDFFSKDVYRYNFSLANQDDLRRVHAVEKCAYAGDSAAAALLAKFYGQKYFDEYIVKAPLFGKVVYLSNRNYDAAKAREWQRIADHLEGKTTLIERERFLKEFLYNQDSTPDGLYNIGYALYHNEHIGDKDKGLDYLKHAANLGDANAARELGEIYHNAFDAHGNKVDLKTAHFWYKVAAETPMDVKIDGETTHYDGHPNGKARAAYLEKAYPELTAPGLVDDNALRNPSSSHIAKYPASAWYVDVPVTDISNIIKDKEHGNRIIGRMEGAVKVIDAHVAEFERMTSIIQARMDDLAARQLVMDGRVADLKGEEITALRQNDALSREQMTQQRLAQLSHDRWVKETLNNLASTVILPILVGMPNDQAMRLAVGNVVRAAGFKGARDNEVAYREALIEELESRKIDTSKFPAEIDALAKQVQALADSKPMQQLLKDETRARALVEGYLRQKILKSGLDNCRSLDDYAKQNGLQSVDQLLANFEGGDTKLSIAISNLCYGHANSNDMEVILADANAMRGSDLLPHEKAFKQFVERVVKGNIAHYMTRASQIDVIEDLNLVNFGTMIVDHSAVTTDLVRGTKELSPEEQGKRQVDAATKMALTTMFSKQFGVTHIGQYDVTRMFSFYLHRHGRDELIASELHDGNVGDELARKRVSVRAPKEMRGFVERAKASAMRGREDQPNVGDLFLRVCGYEYYLPQAVITSGRGNRFKENPEAPVAYPMVNRVVQSFIERMSLSDLPTYREKIGEELDSVIAQTFIDFFNQLGREHTEKFAKDRDYLRDAYAHDNYGPRFDTYEDKITADALGQFPLFMQLYERNLKKELATAPEDVVKLLQQQMHGLDQKVLDYLAPAVAKPGSFQSREEARTLDHRGSNMTEQWRFGG